MTQKPLTEMTHELVEHFAKVADQLQFDFNLYQLHEGQVRSFVEKSLASEMLSKSALKRAIQRIPSINIPRKVTDKLSKVYSESPIRFSQVDQELLNEYTHIMDLNAAMAHANKLSNLNKRAALELYTHQGKQQVRVLAAHQFFVYSDNPMQPNIPTVFVKLLGTEWKQQGPIANDRGKRFTDQEQVRQVQIFACYSDQEFMIMDSEGDIRTDKMQAMGATSLINPFGVIPFVYINKSPIELMPYPNQTAFDMGILIPKLLTDLNYAAQFMSHSVIYIKNVAVGDGALEINPDAILDLGDTGPNGEQPEIGTIAPTVQIENSLRLIEFELSAYLNTEGVKTGGIGKLETETAASGISKIVDESDASEARKEQTELFRQVEKEFWTKFSKMQQLWAITGLVDKRETFSPDLIEGFSIKFADIKPLETEKEKYDKIRVARELRLMSRKQALREIYPNLSEEELAVRLDEIEQELTDDKEKMMAMGLTPGFQQLNRQQQGVSDEDLNGREETD